MGDASNGVRMVWGWERTNGSESGCHRNGVRITCGGKGHSSDGRVQCLDMAICYSYGNFLCIDVGATPW